MPDSSVSINIESGGEAGAHRYAKVPHLWALGVGAVIGGDFYGWQSTLVAGYDGLLVILAFVTVLYVLLAFSIAEMSSMIPAGGGPYIFSLHALGPRSAFFAGLAETMKVIVTVATTLYMIYLYLDALFGIASDYSPLWWLAFGSFFVGLNVLGVEASFKFQVAATTISSLILIIFYIGAATKLDYNKWVVQQEWQFTTWSDTVQGISFGLWFYFGIEELPLAVEETIEPEKNMPRGLLASFATLMFYAVATSTCSSLIEPGATGVLASSAPLVLGYKSVFGDTTTLSYFTWITLVGIISGTHSFVFCMGRLLYAIARDGYFPEILTKVHPTRGSAYMALILGGAASIVISTILHFAIGDARLGSVLINFALIGALVSYSFQLVSFISLRMKQPNRHRPYRSPFGVPGAIMCQFMVIICLIAIIYSGASSTDFLASIVGSIVVFALGSIYYFMVVKPRLDSRPHTPARAKEMRENLLSRHSNSSASRY